MDELDLIRSFRANPAPPTALATARAERAWRRPAPHRPRWAGRAAIAVCVAAAATVAALVIPGERESRLGTPEASAAETLRLAAKSQKGALARPPAARRVLLQPGEDQLERSAGGPRELGGERRDPAMARRAAARSGLPGRSQGEAIPRRR